VVKTSKLIKHHFSKKSSGSNQLDGNVLEENASFIEHLPFRRYRNRRKYFLIWRRGSRETTDGLQDPGIWFALEKSTVDAGLDGGFRLPYLAI